MSASLDLSSGAVFADQFEVVRPLAKGGMGAVYVVKQLGTGRERALKLMHPLLVSDERSLERFEREAKVGSEIESDHVVEVIAAGVERRSGTPWLCMELLKGETLAERIDRRGALERDEAIEAFEQLGHALAAAHRAGIVHRDLKPENVFLAVARRQGVPFTLKVLDFGVAALVKEAASAKTTQGVGSPMWMAPEQTDRGKVTRATDVWALGLIAYHALTGRLYWRTPSKEGASLTALLVEIMVEPLASAIERAAEAGLAARLPAGFDAWFARCVHREPGHRYQDVGAAVADLVQIVRSDRSPAALPRAVPQAFEETQMATGPLRAPAATVARAPTPGGTRPRVWPWLVAAALGALGLGVVSWAMISWAHPGASIESAASVDIEQDGIDPRQVHQSTDSAAAHVGGSRAEPTPHVGAGSAAAASAAPSAADPPQASAAATSSAAAASAAPSAADPAQASATAATSSAAGAALEPNVAGSEAGPSAQTLGSESRSGSAAAAGSRAHGSGADAVRAETPALRASRAPHRASPHAAAALPLLRRCWDGTVGVGAPRTRVHLTLMVGPAGHVRNIRFEGDREALDRGFRACVVQHAASIQLVDPPAGEIAIAAMLGGR